MNDNSQDATTTTEATDVNSVEEESPVKEQDVLPPKRGRGSAESTESLPPKRGRGRPRKTEVAAKKVGNRVGRGRPKGDAAIINEYKARMLASPKSAKVLEKIFDAALDDEHKHQAAAWKLVMDRVLPTAAFEKDVVKGAGRNAIQINITGVGGETTIVGGDDDSALDAEYYESE